MPGGGFGLFDGCSNQWKANSSVWGAQYGGSNTNQCSAYPAALQKGCGFRWDWMQGQSNPTYTHPLPIPKPPSTHTLTPHPPHHSVDYEQVTCPAELVAISGCSVSGYIPPSGGNHTYRRDETINHS